MDRPLYGENGIPVMVTPIDQYGEVGHGRTLFRDTVNHPPGQPPASLVKAMMRGARGRCPACGSTPLFPRFLKPMLLCPACRQDWSHQRADDFPAYVAILVTGHILAPLIIRLVTHTDLSVGAMMVLVSVLALILMIGLLQPAKGAIIAVQWWFGMHGFKPPTPQEGSQD